VRERGSEGGDEGADFGNIRSCRPANHDQPWLANSHREGSEHAFGGDRNVGEDNYRVGHAKLKA
jgi:hypothetical protein